MDSRHNSVSIENQSVRVMCGWCGILLRESAGAAAITSHGICPRCARVLENRSTVDESQPSGELVLSKIEEHTNRLMCRLYETRQALLDVQRRVNADGELIGRVGQILASIRQQERAIAEIQRCIAAAQD
jgi:hypothetical protein